MCENFKKSSKLIFCAFPAHCRAPAEPTYDFYICLPQLFAAHSCFPQLPATPRSTAAHQQPLVLRGAAGNCGKKLCAAKSCGENTGAARISNCSAAEKTLVRGNCRSECIFDLSGARKVQWCCANSNAGVNKKMLVSIGKCRCAENVKEHRCR